MVSLFGLAPDGACHAPFLAVGAVGSYPTVSPLPEAKATGGLFSVALSLKPLPKGISLGGPYPPSCLRGARTFLPCALSGIASAVARPSDKGIVSVLL
jgi:hypothetical protein